MVKGPGFLILKEEKHLQLRTDAEGLPPVAYYIIPPSTETFFPREITAALEFGDIPRSL